MKRAERLNALKEIIATIALSQCVYVFVVSKLNGGATTTPCLTCVACPDGEHGKINGYQKFTGSDADIAYMLQMRQNQIHYISLIDVFALCIVSSSVWKDDALMAKYSGDNEQNFQEHVLTISDETILFLVLLNEAARWSAEVHLETKMVRQFCW